MDSEIIVKSDSENEISAETVPEDLVKVCEYPAGEKNRVTVTISDYKTLEGEIINTYYK